MGIEQPKTLERNPEIKLTNDEQIIFALRNKIQEYANRHVASPSEAVDTSYKIFILEKLLTDGSVNFEDVREKSIKKYGGIDEDVFDNAYGVIKDYNETGGKNNNGGTGLKIEQNQQELSPEKMTEKVKNMQEKSQNVIIKSRTFNKNIWGKVAALTSSSEVIVVYPGDDGEDRIKNVPINEFLEWQKENPLFNKK